MHPLETYLRDLHATHATGAAVPETSYSGALQTLLNEVGKTLKPRVRCVLTLQNTGAGLPDGGLGRNYPRIQILTIAELLRGATVQMPPQYGTFRQAPRVAAAEAQQGRLELE